MPRREEGTPGRAKAAQHRNDEQQFARFLDAARTFAVDSADASFEWIFQQIVPSRRPAPAADMRTSTGEPSPPRPATGATGSDREL